MKKLLGIMVLGLLWCNATYAADKVQIFKGYLKEKDEKVKLLTKAIYASYLDGCSGSNTKYYSLVDKVPDYVDSWNADTRSVEIFESTKLDINCLEKKFEHHLKNYPVESLGSSGSVPFDEIIVRKQDTVSNGITFDMLVITSLFSQQCGERCKFSNEVILIHEGKYWYMRGSNDRGVESKFINKDTILIRNLMTTHRRNYFFDINTKLFTSLPNGGLEFKKDHILVKGQKSYFEGGGAFWFDSKRNYSGEIIELISEGNTCEDITRFYESIQKAMKKQGLQEFCVTRY